MPTRLTILPLLAMLLIAPGCMLSRSTAKVEPRFQPAIENEVDVVEEVSMTNAEIKLVSSTSVDVIGTRGIEDKPRLEINANEKFQPESALSQKKVTLNLGTALSLVGGQHPAVGFARWRLEEAYSQLDQAEVLWLPNIRAGVSYNRHDGNLQASNGAIQDVNRNTFQYGLGAGGVGAGTTPRQGIVADFSLADALFQPRIAEKTAWARGHNVSATMNTQLLNVALAYNTQVTAEQRLSIQQEARDKLYEMAKLARDFYETGAMHQADAERIVTDLHLLDSNILQTREELDMSSARLSEALSLRGGPKIEIQEPLLVPIKLVDVSTDTATVISSGLRCRPELKEAQCLVASACESYQRQKYAPFIPSVLLGYSQTGFGGGLGASPDNIDNRSDFDAVAVWEVRNLGLGEASARAIESSRVQQAKYEQIRLMDRVTREIEEAYSQVIHREQRINVAQVAIESAQKSYDLNLVRVKSGQSTPHDAIRSLQLILTSQLAYVTAVSEYNTAQFRLQWALGWPVHEGAKQ